MGKEFKIKNSDGDFLQVQNYVMQLVAEKKITHTAYVLYSFYRSVAGFREIRMGYRFIEVNSGVSVGSISKCNKLLVENNLITITNNGPNNPFEIEITPGYKLPRREFKYPERPSSSRDEQAEECSPDERQVQPLSSPDERINIDSYKNNTTTGIDEEKQKQYNKLAKKFRSKWRKMYNAKYYTKKDADELLKIEEPEEAFKYIDTLWALDAEDKWVAKSDHSITIFVKEYLSGKLQSYYPKTRQAYKWAMDLE